MDVYLACTEECSQSSHVSKVFYWYHHTSGTQWIVTIPERVSYYLFYHKHEPQVPCLARTQVTIPWYNININYNYYNCRNPILTSSSHLQAAIHFPSPFPSPFPHHQSSARGSCGSAVLPLGGLGGSNTCACLSNTSFRYIGAPFPGIGLRFTPWLDKTGQVLVLGPLVQTCHVLVTWPAQVKEPWTMKPWNPWKIHD